MKQQLYTLLWCSVLCLLAGTANATTISESEPNNTFGDANAVALGDTITGDVSGATLDEDWFSVTTTEDGILKMNFSSTGSGLVYLYIYDNDGTTLLASTTANAGIDDDVQYNKAAAGDYYVRIRYYSAPTDCDYNASVETIGTGFANDAEPNDVYTDAEVMAVNSTTEGHIGYRYNGGALDMNDWFQVTTTENGALSITLEFDPAMYGRLRLYDSNGTTLLANDDAYGTISISRDGLAPGVYYINVNYYSATYYKGYSLSNTFTASPLAGDLEPNDSSLEPLVLPEDGSMTGHIGYRYNGGAYDEQDWYTLTTTSDGDITVQLIGEPGEYHTVQLFANDASTSLASGSAYDTVTISKEGMAAGTYYVLVDHYSTSYFGSYTLSNSIAAADFANDTEPNDSFGEAIGLTENGTAYGHIGFRYDEGGFDETDWYELTTTSDGRISLDLFIEDGEYHTVVLYANDATTQLATGSNYDTVSISKTGLAAGTYYVLVDHYSNSYHSSYELQNTVNPTEYDNDAEPNDVYTEAISMGENETMYGHIGHRYDVGGFDEQDWYVVETTQDGQFSVTMENNTGQYHTIRLYDNDGSTQLDAESGTDSIEAIRYNLAAGTYYILVDHYSSTYFSGYSLTTMQTPPAESNDAEPNDDIASAIPMETNSMAEGHIGFRYNGNTYDENDYYEVYLSQPGDLTAKMVQDDGQYHTLRIRNSAAGILVSASAEDSIEITATGLDSGTYYIEIDHYSTSNYSGYTLYNTYCPDTLVILAEGSTTFCEGESVVLSTEDNHWSYLWNDGSTTATNAVELTGEYTLTVDNGGGCVVTSNLLAVDVTPNPVAIIDLDGPAEFCAGGDVTLSISSDSPDAYLWSTGETTPTITVSESGDYSVELFKGACSAISDPVAITVNENPEPVIAASGVTTFCEGESVELDAGAAESYLWSNGATSATIDVSESGSYSVTITDVNGCSGTSDAVEVVVNAIPVADITAGGPTEFCEGESVELTASAGDTYLWSTGATSASITVTESGSYSVTVTENGCSASSAATDVTVNTAPEATISADGPLTFCEDESVTLTASAGDTYLWSTGETTASIVVNTTGTYTVTVFSAEGCSATSSGTTVTVETCTDELVITADGATEFCEGGSVTLTSNLPDGNVWSTGETTASIVVTESGDYSCTNDGQTSNTITVTVNELPSASISPDGAIDICEGSTTTFTASGGDSYLWSNGATSASVDVGEGDYSVTVTSAAGCSSEAGPVTVNEFAEPTVSVISDLGVKLCYLETTTLEVTANGGTIQWRKNGVDIPGANASTYMTGEQGLYTCVVDNGVCDPVESETITVRYTSPIPLVTTGTIYICSGSTTLLEAPFSAFATYQWYKNGDEVAGATSYTYETGTPGNYYVVATRDGCSRRSVTATVLIDCRLADIDSHTFEIYPNPANTTVNLHVQTENDGPADLLVTRLDGAVVYAGMLSLTGGSQNIPLAVGDWADGVYVVSIRMENGKLLRNNLVIQK